MSPQQTVAGGNGLLASAWEAAGCTWMECPVGLRGNLNVSLNDGSLSCRQTLVFFLMIRFCVATFTTYSLTYRSEGAVMEKRRMSELRCYALLGLLVALYSLSNLLLPGSSCSVWRWLLPDRGQGWKGCCSRPFSLSSPFLPSPGPVCELPWCLLF